jgi:hypothetical protein
MMEMTVLREEIKKRTPEEQEKLANFIAALRSKSDPEHLTEIDRRLQDNDSANWMTLDEVKRSLA